MKVHKRTNVSSKLKYPQTELPIPFGSETSFLSDTHSTWVFCPSLHWGKKVVVTRSVVTSAVDACDLITRACGWGCPEWGELGVIFRTRIICHGNSLPKLQKSPGKNTAKREPGASRNALVFQIALTSVLKNPFFSFFLEHCDTGM